MARRRRKIANPDNVDYYMLRRKDDGIIVVCKEKTAAKIFRDCYVRLFRLVDPATKARVKRGLR